MRSDVQKKRLVGLVLGVALIVTLGGFVISGDIGDPSIPDDVAVVVEGTPEEEITLEELDQNLEQAAFNQNLREVPPEDDPQFPAVQEAAMQNLIQSRWVRGEAAERGITVTERDVDEALETIINDQLGGQKGYERFIKQSPFDEQAVREVAELSAISDRLQAEALPEAAPEVSESTVEEFYEANIEQFEQPEARDARVILNPDAAEIEEALAALGEDNSPQSWERVAKRFSTDEATRNDGGLRRDVTEGQSEPALDEAIFSAEEGEVVGPIEGDSGNYVIQVEQTTPGETTPLGDVSEQIRQTLQQGIQSQEIERFSLDFTTKWTSRTFCAEDLLSQLCANAAPAPDPCTIDDASEREQADPATFDAGCPAPVTPRGAINPGSGSLFPGEQVQALPQGPVKPAPTAPPGLPLGPEGAPAAPGGGAAPPPSGGTPPPASP